MNRLWEELSRFSMLELVEELLMIAKFKKSNFVKIKTPARNQITEYIRATKVVIESSHQLYVRDKVRIQILPRVKTLWLNLSFTTGEQTVYETPK